MTGEVERKDGQVSAGQPYGQVAPSVQVCSYTVHEHGPPVATSEALTAQHHPARARKLDWERQGGFVRRLLAVHIVKCRSRC